MRSRRYFEGARALFAYVFSAISFGPGSDLRFAKALNAYLLALALVLFWVSSARAQVDGEYISLDGQLGGSVLAGELSGDLVLLGVGAKLQTWRRTDALSTPTLEGETLLPNPIVAVGLVDGTAVVLLEEFGLVALDVTTTPTTPTIIDNFALPTGSAHAAFDWDDNNFYVLAGSNWHGRSTLYAIERGAPSDVFGDLRYSQGVEAFANDALVHDGMLYVADGQDKEIERFDVSDPTTTTAMATLTGLNWPERLDVHDGRLYVSDFRHFRIYDTAPPNDLLYIVTGGNSRHFRDVAVSGDAFLMAEDGALHLYDYKTTEPLLLRTWDGDVTALSGATTDAMAWNPNDAVMFFTTDATSPGAIQLNATLPVVGRFDYVLTSGTLMATVSERDRDPLELWEVSAPAARGPTDDAATTRLGAMSLESLATANDIAMDRERSLLFVSLGQYGLLAVDLSDPSSPVLLQHYVLPDELTLEEKSIASVATTNTTVYGLAQEALWVFDALDSTSLTVATSVTPQSTGDEFLGMSLYQDQLVVNYSNPTSNISGVVVYRLTPSARGASDGQAPDGAPAVDNPDWVSGLQLTGEDEARIVATLGPVLVIENSDGKSISIYYMHSDGEIQYLGEFPMGADSIQDIRNAESDGDHDKGAQLLAVANIEAAATVGGALFIGPLHEVLSARMAFAGYERGLSTNTDPTTATQLGVIETRIGVPAQVTDMTMDAFGRSFLATGEGGLFIYSPKAPYPEFDVFDMADFVVGRRDDNRVVDNSQMDLNGDGVTDVADLILFLLRR